MDRDLMMHKAMSLLRGFSMLSCGDEIVQLNGWDYKEEPDRIEDSRNLHRSAFIGPMPNCGIRLVPCSSRCGMGWKTCVRCAMTHVLHRMLG